MIPPMIESLTHAALLLVEIGVAVPALYLATVTSAALWASHRRQPHLPHGYPDKQWPQLVALVPAHNEEALIGRLLENLAQLHYPRARLAVYVIADNCDDATATIAGAFAGAHVWAHVLERTDAQRRGKGYAIRWALERLQAMDVAYDACVLFDADSLVDADCLLALAAAYQRGADAVQGQYAVSNAFATPSTSLRWLALTLMNHIRQLGRTTLGASSALTGNGMLFSRALLERHPWNAFGLTEDYQYYIDLVEHGERIHYAPDALVRAEMPTTFTQMRTQDKRWESGLERSTAAIALSLFRAALRYRSAAPLEAVMELLTPPLSLLVGLAAVTLLAALALSWPPALILALVIWACLGFYIGSTLWLERPPLALYRALLYAPLYLCWKLWVKIVVVRLPHRSREWVRTSRVG
jgi:cellulose synthase/poly-beta-1,6-N-acetylglucosamine synthase-like glycosyltransferase